MHLIPDSWSHLHILASVFPSVGLVFALGFYVVAMITNNTGLTRICLAVFTLLGLVAIPTYFSGTGSWDALSGNSKISDDLMDYHYGWGVTALAVLMASGAVAFIEILRSSRFGKFSNNALHLVLGLAIVSLGLMAVVGEMGWWTSISVIHLFRGRSPIVAQIPFTDRTNGTTG